MSDVIHIVYPEEELPEYLLKTVLLNESGLFLPASGIMRRKCGFSEVWYQKDGIRNLEETERLEEW
ncbi:MAG: hypothetical protein PUC44_02220, partial [Eubacteriales bacterium]|nr:hypothetical protein [Eubacteriales bacterium]